MPQLHVDVQRVMVRGERPGVRAARHALQHRRLDLDEVPRVQLGPDGAKQRRASGGGAAGLEVGREVQVAAALLQVGVLQAVPLLGQRAQGLREHRERPDLQRQLTALRADHEALGAHDVAEVDLVQQRAARLVERGALAEELDVAGGVAQDQEGQLAHPAGQDDAPGQGRATIGLLARGQRVLELGEEVGGVRVGVEPERERLDPGLAQSLERVAPRAAGSPTRGRSRPRRNRRPASTPRHSSAVTTFLSKTRRRPSSVSHGSW